MNKKNMNFSIEFASRKILNENLDLEKKIIIEIFKLDLNQVMLTDLSDIYNLQETDLIQLNLKKVFNMKISIEEIEKLNLSQLIQLINKSIK